MKPYRKVLFIGRSTYHFSYYESILRALIEEGAQLTIGYDEGWSANQPDAALRAFLSEFPQVGFTWVPRRQDRWRRFIFPARELRSYASYVSRPEQSRFYLERWQKYLTPALRALVGLPMLRHIVGSGPVRAGLRWFENLVPAAPEVVDFVRSIDPEVIVSTPVNMRFSEEVETIKAGKALGIPTILPVLSWDNLTTKGLIHITPTQTLAWNDAHAEEAIVVHGIAKDAVTVVGSPFFDKWLDRDTLRLARSEFLARLGLSPDESYLLYLGSSANIAVDETWVVEEILTALQQHPDSRVNKLRIVARPHPANFDKFKRLEALGIVCWPKQGSLPESLEAKQDFFNSVDHSIAVIGINTSGMIDATIMGKPCLAFVTEKYARTQSQAVHFGHLVAADVVARYTSGEGVADGLLRLQTDGDDRERQRTAFILDFVRPYGQQNPAGRVAAEVICAAAEGLSGHAITARLESTFRSTPTP